MMLTTYGVMDEWLFLAEVDRCLGLMDQTGWEEQRLVSRAG